MAEMRFVLLRAAVDIFFATALFFGFMCGVHYGAQLIGLHFWFVKLLLGVVGIGIMVSLTGWLKVSLLFFVKNGSIYAQCRDDCNSVMGAFKGVLGFFGETISIVAFNRILRECLGSVSEGILNPAGDSRLSGLLGDLNQTKIAKVSVKVMQKAFDYVDECILGYCYQNASDGKEILQCAVEAFVLFIRHSPQIFGKVLTVISVEMVIKVFYWLLFIVVCKDIFYFGFGDLPVSLMNAVVCYCIGKILIFLLEDAVFEPLLMHGVINSFKGLEWNPDCGETESGLAEAIPAFNRLRVYCSGGDGNDKSGDGHTDDGQASEGDRVDPGGV